MRFIKKRKKSWGFMLMAVTLVMLAGVAVPLAQGVTSTAPPGLAGSGVRLINGLTWTQVGETGFGDANNVEVKSMAVFMGYLYTGNKNSSTGTEMWRTADGLTWEQANTDGFGDANNMNVFALVPFDDHLYAATDNSTMGGGTGGEVWRTADGTTWDQVNTDGFGDANNIVAWTMAVFSDTLYVGTLNQANGAEIWRSTDGTTWDQANTDGFGDVNNVRALFMAVFDEYLYVGTKNSATDSEIWRTSDGTSWTQANSDGFGSAANDGAYALAPFGGYLYAGTRNRSTGGQLWRTANGTTWESVMVNGFGDTDNDTINVLAALGDDFYAGTARADGATTGAELWRSSDGISWTQVNSDGFGVATNEQINCLAALGSYYYAGVWNETIGGQVWRTSSISTCTVTSTLDSGAGTLRECLENAPSGQTITFDPAVFPSGAPATIALTSPLPDITQGDLIIDGTGAGVIIDGSGIAEDADCLLLASNGNTVRGLRAGGCAYGSVSVSGANNTVADNVLFGSGAGVALWSTDAYSNTVTGNYIGTDPAGSAGLGNESGGVFITNGAHDNIIGGYTPAERNVISNNGGAGVVISRSGTNDNLVVGNYIGTDPAGTVGLGNVYDGVCIVEGAQHNTIEGNVIGGNGANGVAMDGAGSDSNIVIGNLIGLTADGATALGNSANGVDIRNGAQGNTVGGYTPEERNVISGNEHSGIRINGEGTDGNVVTGNYIGVDANGTAVLGNGFDGVAISDGPQNNIIGGDTLEERNVISGNGEDGVSIAGEGTDNNTVSGNYIGTDVNGTVALANGEAGVHISEGAQNNTIGGDMPEERNVISGNGGLGVSIEGSGTNANTVIGNFIGTDASGTAALGNGFVGVSIFDSAKNNTIGGTTAGERNVISGNLHHGVAIYGWPNVGTDNNTVIGNYIGTDVNGTAALGNATNGVRIGDGAKSNVIGGDTPGERNVISGNGEDGILIGDEGTDDNVVAGNYIGTDANGTVALANGGHGVEIVEGAGNNTVGGSTDGERNVIGGNERYGIRICDEGTDGNVVSGNYIGVDATGLAALGNDGDGVIVACGAKQNRVGGATAGERNVISANGCLGVGLGDPGTDDNVVSGNYIGTDASGTAALGNGCEGVEISNGPQNNTIGGDTPGERNVISGNGGNGIAISNEGTDNNTVSGNYIGVDATGVVALGNGDVGVRITAAASNSNVLDNVISGNVGEGVLIQHEGSDNNTVAGNYIGVDANGAVALANALGVRVELGAQNNTIGGDTPGERNVISGNGEDGILIKDEDTDNNTVIGNYIGTDVTGLLAVGNLGSGVDIFAPENALGGTAIGEGNVISANGGAGVFLAGGDANSNTVQGNLIGVGIDGLTPLGNQCEGVAIQSSARNNLIGGAEAGAGNVIAHNGDVGVLVRDGDTTGNTISRNSITANGGTGIQNQNGGNTELTPPTVTSASCNSVSGTALPNSTVEIFSDPADEGKTYEGTTTADATGAFTWTGSISDPNVTATATDGAGNTSEFSMPLGACYRIYLPLVTKNHQ